MALMVGAFIIQGITPGPNVIHDEPALFWGLIVSMWVGNLMLVLLNLPLIGIWVRMLTIPYNVLFPAIIAFACIGCYSINLNVFHIYAIAFFGIVGYALVKLGCEPAPLLLGFVLGPLLEEHLRRAMIISRGDPTIFLTRPISAALARWRRLPRSSSRCFRRSAPSARRCSRRRIEAESRREADEIRASGLPKPPDFGTIAARALAIGMVGGTGWACTVSGFRLRAIRRLPAN